MDVATYDDTDRIRDALVRQAFSPVRWIETVQAIAARGVGQYTHECGPGKVLAGMSKRIESGLVGAAIADADGLQQAIAATELDDEDNSKVGSRW